MTHPICWKKVLIKETYCGLWDGPHATPKESESGPIFLGIKNITEDGQLNLSEIRHISEVDYSAWIRRVEPKPGDIVFTYEATLHRYAIIPVGFRGCLGRRLALIRPNPEIVDRRFLFYYFFGKAWRETVSKYMILGSTVDRIPIIEFPNFEVNLPPLPTQRKIAAILSAYDNLIENNTRRIKILEEMAQTIYREWFVHFRFPGHEGVKMVETELGMAPEGWKIHPFSAIAEFRNGYAFKPSDWGKDGIPIIKIAELKNGITSNTPYNPGSNVPPKYLINNGDVLFSWSADLNVYLWAHGEGLLNQHLFNVTPINWIPKSFLFYSLLDKMQEFRSRSSGTTMRHIKRSALDQVKCLLPPKRLVSDFDNRVIPILGLYINLITKNKVLQNGRDLLLPKLVSGELDVSELEIAGVG